MKKIILMTMLIAVLISGCKGKEKPPPIEPTPPTITEEVPEETPAPINTPEPTVKPTEVIESPIPEPTTSQDPNIGLVEYKPDVALFFETSENMLDSLMFGENVAVLYETNKTLISTSVTELGYQLPINKTIVYNGESLNIATYLKKDSPINEKIYLGQNVNMIGLSFSGTADINTEESEIEVFSDNIRTLTGLFISDIDLSTAIGKIENSWNEIKKTDVENNTYNRVIWYTDNTQIISLSLCAYEKDGEIYTDFSFNVMINNADLKYLDNIRIDFKLGDIRLKEDTAIIGNVIGFKPAAMNFNIFDVIYSDSKKREGLVTSAVDGIVCLTSVPDSIKIKAILNEDGLSYLFVGWEELFDIKEIKLAPEGNTAISTDLYGLSSCTFQLNPVGMPTIKVNYRGSSFFTIEEAKGLFRAELEAIAGISITEKDLNSLVQVLSSEYQTTNSPVATKFTTYIDREDSPRSVNIYIANPKEVTFTFE